MRVNALSIAPLLGASCLITACVATEPDTGTARSRLEVSTLLAEADTDVRQAPPHANHGDAATLRIRSSSRSRALIRFDADAIAAVVGDGALVSAHLEVEIVDNREHWGPDRSLDVHRVIGAWTELGATWQTAPAWVATPSSSVPITDATTGVLAFDVTADVAATLAGEPDHGWIVKSSLEPHAGRVELGARESAVGPRLVLAVEPPSPPDGTLYAATAVGDLARDGAAVYFPAIGIGTLRLSDLDGSTTLLTTAPSEMNKVAVDDTHLYLLERGPGTVTRFAKLGGPGEVIATGLFGGEAIDVDDAYVYASRGGADDQALWRFPKAGGAGDELDTGLRTIWDLGVDGSDVYYTEFYTGSVHRMPKAGGARTTIATRSGNATYLEVGVEHVYFTTVESSSQNAGPSSVNRVAKAGGGHTELQVNPGGFAGVPHGLDLAGDWLYWSRGSGEVQRAPALGPVAIETLLDRPGRVLEVEVIDDALYYAEEGVGIGKLSVTP
jgi:hypothetical protein